jgi:hypothetical protein
VGNRTAIPQPIQTEVLTLSARRCAICFGLENSADIQQGQIAHLDQDPDNSDLENLAFLCLRHHDQYDSKPQQSKGLSIGEVKGYRERLYESIEKWRHRTSWDRILGYTICNRI